MSNTRYRQLTFLLACGVLCCLSFLWTAHDGSNAAARGASECVGKVTLTKPGHREIQFSLRCKEVASGVAFLVMSRDPEVGEVSRAGVAITDFDRSLKVQSAVPESNIGSCSRFRGSTRSLECTTSATGSVFIVGRYKVSSGKRCLSSVVLRQFLNVGGSSPPLPPAIFHEDLYGGLPSGCPH